MKEPAEGEEGNTLADALYGGTSALDLTDYQLWISTRACGLFSWSSAEHKE